MMSIPAIEQLTGAVASKALTLGAIAEANAGASMAGAIAELGKARDDGLAKEKARDDAKVKGKAEVTVAGATVDACAELDKAQTDEARNALHADVKAKSDECKKKKADAQAAQARLDDAKAHHEAVDKRAKESGLPVGAKSGIATSTTGAALERGGGASSVEAVAMTVREIVSLNFRQDEFMFLCLKVLSPKDLSN